MQTVCLNICKNSTTPRTLHRIPWKCQDVSLEDLLWGVATQSNFTRSKVLISKSFRMNVKIKVKIFKSITLFRPSGFWHLIKVKGVMQAWNNLFPNAFHLAKRDASSQVDLCSSFVVLDHYYFLYSRIVKIIRHMYKYNFQLTNKDYKVKEK